MGELRMLEDAKKDRVIAITSFCNTEEKLNVLIVNISLLRSKFPEYKIALHANYPLSESIQKLVDIYIYEDLNYIDENNVIFIWKKYPHFNRKFACKVPDAGFSVFQQIKSITKHLIEYNRILLINYDTSVEEITPNDYMGNYDLILHKYGDEFPSYTLILMFFNPKTFFDKVATQFTLDWWSQYRHMFAEQKFYDAVQVSNINYYVHNHKVSDKIRAIKGLVFSPLNTPQNEFFNYFFLSYQRDKFMNENNTYLELYLWGLKNKVHCVLGIDNEGNSYDLRNQITDEVFECVAPLQVKQLTSLQIKKINETQVDFTIEIKEGYYTIPLVEPKDIK